MSTDGEPRDPRTQTATGDDDPSPADEKRTLRRMPIIPEARTTAPSEASPHIASPPIPSEQLTDWMIDDARTSSTGGEPLAFDNGNIVKVSGAPVQGAPAPPSAPARPSTQPVSPMMSGGLVQPRRVPVRAIIATAFVGASIGIAILWARSSEPAETTTMQTTPAATSLPAGSAETPRAPSAPSPRRAEERSGGVPTLGEADAAIQHTADSGLTEEDTIDQAGP